MYATLPFAAGFMLSGNASAQGLQYEAPGIPVTGDINPYPASGAMPYPANSGGTIVAAPNMPSDMTKNAQLEAQLREMTNQLEQRDFQIRQLQQNFDRYKSDSESRIQALESKMSGTITGTEQPTGPQPTYNASGAYTGPSTGSTATPPAPTPVQNDMSAAAPASGVNTGQLSGTLDDANGAFRPSTTPQLGQITETNTAPNPDGSITSGRPQGGSTAGAPQNAAQAYDQAFAYLQQTNYSDAQRAFSDFLKNYATHPLAANAQYWLGETYFAQTQYSLAAKTFAKAFQDHPQGQKAPDALLKLALTLEKMNKKDDACLTLGELTKRFPSGPASVLRRGNEETARMGCKV